MNVTHSLTTLRLALSTIPPLFTLDPFGRYSRFCHIDFDKEVISDYYGSVNGRYRWEVLNLSDFRVFS